MQFKNKSKIYFSAILVITFLLLPVLPRTAGAVFPVTEVGPDNVAAWFATAGATVATAASTGLVGTGQVPIDTLRAAAGEDCVGIIATLGVAESVDAVINLGGEVGFNLVGGDLFETGLVTKQIGQLVTVKDCVDPYVLAVQHAAVTPLTNPTLLTSQSFVTELDLFTKIQQDVNQRLQDLQARKSATTKEVLKAVLTNVLLNLNKTLTTKVVNGLINKYKISDYAEYANIVGTQLYAMNYIQKNLPDDQQGQAILRSLIQDRQFPGQGNIVVAEQLLHEKSRQYLGYDFATLSTNDPDFYAKLSKAGSAKAGTAPGSFQFMVFNPASEQAAAATQSGLATVNQEVSQGNGFSPTRNCAGSIDQQQATDAEYKRLAEKAQFDSAVFANISSSAPAEEIAKAAELAKTSREALVNAPQVVGDSIIKICEAIASPADFISTSINAWLKTSLEETTGLKSDNLPFFGQFLSTVASNFVTNIITGGFSSAKQVNEGGLSAIGLGTANIDTSTDFNSVVPPTFPNTNGNGQGGGSGGGNGNGNSGGGGGSGGGGDSGNGNGNGNGNNNGDQTNPDIQISYQPNPAIANADFDLFINYPAETTLYKPRNLVFYSNDSTTSDQNLILEDTDPNPINLHSAAPSETTKLTIEVLATNKQTGIVESLGRNSITIIVNSGGTGGGGGTVQGAFIRKPGTQIGAKYTPRGLAIKPR